MEFRLAPHSRRLHVAVVELWHDEQLLGEITPGDDPGSLRVITKYAVMTQQRAGRGTAVDPDVLTVMLDLAQTVRAVR